MTNNYYKKTQRRFKDGHVKGTKILLKKKKKRSVDMVVNDKRIFYSMSIEKMF